MPPQGIVTGPVHHRLPISLLSRSNPEDLLVPEDAETPNMRSQEVRFSRNQTQRDFPDLFRAHYERCLTVGLIMSRIPKIMWARPKPNTPAPNSLGLIICPMIDTTAPTPTTIQLVVFGSTLIPPIPIGFR